VGLIIATAALSDDLVISRDLKRSFGSNSIAVSGVIMGRRIIDYTVRVRAGEVLSATLVSGNPGLAFNVLPPGSNDFAIDGAIGLKTWRGALLTDGEYAIRIYLDRAGARRGESADFRLTVTIQDDAGPVREIPTAMALPH